MACSHRDPGSCPKGPVKLLGPVADSFCASRLDGDWAPTFGTLPAAADTAAIIEFARLR